MSASQKAGEVQVFVNVLPGRYTLASTDRNRLIIAYDDFGGRLKISPGIKEQEPRLAYILPSSATTDVLLQSLSLFNELDMELDIYCSRQLRQFGSQFSNEHISFHEIGEEETKIVADVIVTYSLQAIYFIRQLLPVLILGPCGIGGWVTPSNLPFLANSGFMGRPGGLPGEIIPLMVWMEELKELTTSDEMPRVLAENKKIADSLPYIGTAEIQAEVARRNVLGLMELDAGMYWELKPRYCSNISRVDTDDAIFFKRLEINDTIAGIPIGFSTLLDSINGQHKTADVFRLSDLSRNEFIELFDALIEVKVITF